MNKYAHALLESPISLKLLVQKSIAVDKITLFSHAYAISYKAELYRLD